MKLHHKLGISGGLIFLLVSSYQIGFFIGQEVRAAQNRYAISILEQVKEPLNTCVVVNNTGRPITTENELFTWLRECNASATIENAPIYNINNRVNEIESLYTNQ